MGSAAGSGAESWSDGAAWDLPQGVGQSHGVMELHGICRREWSRIAAVTAARQGAEVCQLKSGWSVWQEELRIWLSQGFGRSLPLVTVGDGARLP